MGKSRTFVVSAKIATFALVVVLGWAWAERVKRTTSDEVEAPETQTIDGLTQATNEPTQWGASTSPQATDAVTAASSASGSDVNLGNAQALIDKGSAEEGAAILEELIRRDPTNTQAMMELAMVYTLDYKSPAKARVPLERILDVNANHRAALNELELIYTELGAQTEGIDFLHLKVEQNPDAPELLYTYGRMLSASDPEASIPLLTKATEIPDVREQALNDLALAALRAGRPKLAIDSWKKALAIAETELEQAKADGKPGIDYLEDRIAATRSEIANAENRVTRQ